MINGKRISVVLPAYNAEKTLEATVQELPDLVDIRILVHDHSSDRTVEIAHRLGLQYYVHVCHSAKTEKISFLTTRCWRSPYILATVSARYRLRRSISRKGTRSISAAASSTAWVLSEQLIASPSGAPGSRPALSSVKQRRL